MTIQWTLIAAFLYIELGLITLLLLPFILPKIWQSIFYSRACRFVANQANVYFTVLIIVLVLFFLDSVREMMKYSTKSVKDYDAELQTNMKLFRSQRNYYISGFAVFLWLVIRRLIMLVLTEADLICETETAMKRAQSATETVQKLMKKKEEIERSSLNSALKFENREEIENLRKTLAKAENDLADTKQSIIDVQNKAKETSKEYELLHLKFRELQESSI